jgi:hypothetical protein
MNEFVEGTPAPSYDAGRLMAAGRRRRPPVWALAAVVAAVAAVGVGVAVLPGGGGARQVAPPAATSAPVVVPQTPKPSPSTDPTSVDPQGDTLRAVVTAAELYQNPATRSKVDLTGLAARFTSQAVFRQVWGTDGRGALCGTAADGATNPVAGSVGFYKGAQRQPKDALYTFDQGAKIAGISCSAKSGGSGDPVMGDVYGSILSGAKAGDGLLGPNVPSATCGQNGFRTWFADDQASGTLTEGWTLRLDGGAPIVVTIDPNTPLLTEVHCST